MLFLSPHNAAEGGRCSSPAAEIPVVFAAASFQLEFGLWVLWRGCRAAPAALGYQQEECQ